MVTSIETIVAINRLRGRVADKVNNKTMKIIDYNLDTLIDNFQRIRNLSLADVFEVFNVDHLFTLFRGLRTETQVIVDMKFLEGGDIEYSYYNFETFRYGKAKFRRFNILRGDYSDDLYLLLGNPIILEKPPRPGSTIVINGGSELTVQTYNKQSKLVTLASGTIINSREYLVLDVPLKPVFEYEVVDVYPEGFRQTKLYSTESDIPQLNNFKISQGVTRTITVVEKKVK